MGGRTTQEDPTRQAQLEIEQMSPLRGRIRVDGAEAVEFQGWGELRYRLIGGQPAPEVALTEHELRVASLACEGLSNSEIAEALVLSPRTVQWHLNRAFKKLSVRTRTELAVAWLTSEAAGKP